jgi:hypothetical protein
MGSVASGRLKMEGRNDDEDKREATLTVAEVRRRFGRHDPNLRHTLSAVDLKRQIIKFNAERILYPIANGSIAKHDIR